MSDVWYYDATESNRHADADKAYPRPDHPGLADAELVRPMREVPESVTKVREKSDPVDDGDGFDYEAFRDQHWRSRVSAIEAGEVDAHLDTIAEQTTSDAVADAVAERRDD